jgi:beta-N-acetylhexosaminidase
MIGRRQLICGALGLLPAGPIKASTDEPTQSSSNLASNVGEMLMLGFAGNSVDSPSAQRLADHIEAKRVRAVVFVKENVGSREEVSRLVQLFSAKSTPLIAIDHEGGFVQRLGERHGFTTIASARAIAATLSVREAQAVYEKAATELASLGFNVNLAPVVDLHDPDCPEIGRYDRAFASDPATVAAYAEAFIDGFASTGIQCALKHFPGEGHSRIDTHHSLSDITATWSEQDIEPYLRLFATNRARIVMCSHVRLEKIEKKPIPITLSSAAVRGFLREKLGFPGVIMTDDLDMAATGGIIDPWRRLLAKTLGISGPARERRETVIRAIAAGNDLLMIRNASGFDADLPQKVTSWVQEAIDEGTLNEGRIAESAERVRRLKQSQSTRN